MQLVTFLKKNLVEPVRPHNLQLLLCSQKTYIYQCINDTLTSKGIKNI